MSELISGKEAFSRWVVTHPDNLKITAYEEGIMFDAWQAAKAQAVPEGNIIAPLRDLRIVMELAEDHCDEYIRTNEFPEVHKAIHDVKAMIEAQDPAND